jgi:DNA mismatch repair protein MSH6
MWSAASDAITELDVLMSLAVAATSGDGGDMCRPQFVADDTVFEAEQLRHPCAFMTTAAGSFVANDIALGGSTGAAPFLLLTGPNMGGKSTLLRQVCLAAVLAQVGAWVPARSLRLSAADAVFVRMGARDHIMAGESTFYVELMETSAMLQVTCFPVPYSSVISLMLIDRPLSCSHSRGCHRVPMIDACNLWGQLSRTIMQRSLCWVHASSSQ